MVLTFTTLWAYSADYKLRIYVVFFVFCLFVFCCFFCFVLFLFFVFLLLFFTFPGKPDLEFHANCLICMKCQTWFLWGKKE